MLTIKIYTRFRSNSPVFLRISRREWEKYLSYWGEVEPYLSGDNWLEKCKGAIHFTIINLVKSEEHFMQSIVFAAMSLEAFIYDYASHNFSDTYAKKYLDRLDIASKWVIISKMITGKDFPTDSKAFKDLQRLIKERNNIVHSKSSRMPRGENTKELVQEIGPKLKKEAETQIYFNKTPPYEIIIEVLQELRKLEGENDISMQWWQIENVDDDYDDFKYFKKNE